MRTFKTILLVLCATLLVVDISCRIWVWHQFASHFKLEIYHTNDVSSVGIAEAKTGKLLWVEWDYPDKSKEFSYFYSGTNIFNLNVWPGRPLTYSVGFHGPGKSSVWWWDLARGTFVERNFFDTNGDFSKFEVWYHHTWHTAVRRDGKSGIIINGQWRQLALPTNSMWTIEGTPTNQLSPNTALEPTPTAP
jgi:hypothetical protein